ncbi:DNA phosphorothioation-dependent restriction protein DptG [Methanococcus maripaludis]|uniref:DNA phosphorothioation-dependent restriction protein DptG n=1 Tax=Methanococcus maripaludis TaxID=39152 RepID=A0A7J9PLD3_METMI|nr:DNA phosphorothioation-dependent restriction protein DptG [Methanococcus maripaludis]MBA2864032.1 DNA phosphorothioation-dependent restriction protein DptG [Methanococcus maripaludis]
MDYNLDMDEIKSFYKYGAVKSSNINLKHSTPKRIPLFPYTVKKTPETSDFLGVASDFARLSISKSLHADNVGNLKKVELIEKICDKIDMSEENIPDYHLRMFFEEIFFENEKLVFFHPKLLFRLDGNNKLSNISDYLYDIFACENLKKYFETIEKNRFSDENILTDLLYANLHDLKDSGERTPHYRVTIPNLRNVFLEDFEYLMNDSEFFVENIERFLKYYYFIHTSQLSIKLDGFFNADYSTLDQLYFTLEWEKTSKSRESYKRGWKLLEPKAKKIFSHVNCLEMLNHSNDPNTYMYPELKEIILNMDEEGTKKLYADLSKILVKYKSAIESKDFWEDFKYESRYPENKVLDKIYEIFKAIDYQFLNSKGNRKGVYNNYSGWFIDFSKANLLKKRGSLGNMLNINQDYLIMITRLSIKNGDKIRLNDLYEEYERRGLYFDKESKKNIREFFEKLNLIVKKSDSGDAIYVRPIL